ncbi:hypothetical protein ACFL6A_03525 [bacterium]
MQLREALHSIRVIRIPEHSPAVVTTCIEEIKRHPDCSPIEVRQKKLVQPGKDFVIAVASLSQIEKWTGSVPGKAIQDGVAFSLCSDGSGWLLSTKQYYLMSFLHHLFSSLANEDLRLVQKGKFFQPSFSWQRIVYDFFLTQEGRIQRNFNRASYIRELARLGFTHMEVNGLAFREALETGPKGETYPMFYTYCPALDQFVASSLNRGVYPEDYLSENMNYLKTNAELAVQQGLTPGLLCFEPRSVPESFFRDYPMLRGARVDHPFRSFKPRYNMTIVHPKVQEHYAEMMEKLLKEIPQLGYLCIWTNDSGAGFEHTKSLYVGRNGGAYLIREWKDDEEIAKCAGENALRFFRILRDAARKTNPDFRLITRMESFYGEHDIIWQGLGGGLDIETASLVMRGWDMPYTHPRYPDVKEINAGTVYQTQMNPDEHKLLNDLKKKDSEAHFYFTVGAQAMFAPLQGIPYPNLTYERLQLLRSAHVSKLAHLGGSFSPELVPYNINHEITRRFQWNPAMKIGDEITKIAGDWSGSNLYGNLIEAWALAEESILAFPNVTPLYSTHGFIWYRLWVRPLVPDIEALSLKQRAYYENFMCTTPHNPNNIDLSRDVLFQLTTPEKCRLALERIDRHVWKPLDRAIDILNHRERAAALELGQNNVIHDQLIRLKALRCWFMTQRNVAGWIVNVYGYMNTKRMPDKKRHHRELQGIIQKEIENTKQVIHLLDTNIEFMAITDQGETPLIHGTNIKGNLTKRIKIMEAHQKDIPRINTEFMEQNAGEKATSPPASGGR